MTTPWRGSVLFVGVAAVIGAAAAARFAAAEDAATATAGVPSSATTSTDSSSSDGSSGSTGDDSDASTSTSTSSAADDASGEQTVVGSTVSTPYGDVQVSVTFDGTTITSVQTLQAPDDQQSDGATPTLASEVVDGQSADVDTVSGATYTSEAYLESVQYAIDHR